MKKKILFVIDSLHSGGAEKSLISLLTLFDFQKYEVDLLMFSPNGLYLPLLPKEVNVIEVPVYMRNQMRGFKHLIRQRNFKQIFVRLGVSTSLRIPHLKKNMHGAQINWGWISKEIEKLDKKYDVAIAYSQGMPTYFVAEKVSAVKKLSWVNIDYKIAGYNKEFDINYYEKFNQIIAVSELCKDVLVSELPSMKSKVTVIYDIISPILIRSMSNENGGFTEEFEGMRILTIGRLVHQKGYEWAIEACHKLKEEGFKFKWFAIGEGELKTKLEETVKRLGLEDTFIFLGTHQNPYTYLKQSDVYVQPSRFEGYGLAIAEARILHIPIVTTNFTVVHNQITDRENGLIVNMNSEDIYMGIKNMMEDGSLRQKISSNLKKENVGTEEEIHKVYALIES
ncbi:glycosyltransferase [Paenibacillus planticolens]|uniref:Glycosyltransferase n=1 Tax=Paenibacillus planticolens TaxID=2654976 RepID=A0ABX1ZJE0_9BACL|nr:glycosyltransferase [Paenibacillus planticolens]NOV00212.1 glycosyltransferase [Paenibacillus planticolens]